MLPPRSLSLLTHYSFPHDQINCQKPCTRLLECSHPCTQICSAECKSKCECRPAVEVDTTVRVIASSPSKRIAAKGSEPSPSERQTQPHNSSQHGVTTLQERPPALSHNGTSSHLLDLSTLGDAATQAFQHGTQSFQEYATGGHLKSDRNLGLLAVQEQAEARQRRLDDENWAALFGDPTAPVLTKPVDNVKLVRTKTDGMGGSRGVYKGTFDVPRAQSTTGATQEDSLLDLL